MDEARVVVRLKRSLGFEPQTNLHGELQRGGLLPWDRLTARFPGLRISPVFPQAAAPGAPMALLARRARELDPSYRPADFTAFYYIDAPPGADVTALVQQLLEHEAVEEAYIDHVGPDPSVEAGDDPRASSQGYLNPAPEGIDARYAWTLLGGDGEGQRFADIEKGWTLDHEDLVGCDASLVHGTLLNDSRAHGTAVLGEICARDNKTGCIGIAPNVRSVFVSSYYGSTLPRAIVAAIGKLCFGDVLLLEAQVWLNGTRLLGPIEAYDLEFEAIRLATAAGIIVVEAGGNGTNNGGTPALDMDAYRTLSGKAILNRDPANPDFRDSGAIVVTAAASAAPHTRLAYGPYGRRIDCFAWGQNVSTLSSNAAGARNLYKLSFGGTSGASPIVAGAALLVQGRAQAQLGRRLGPMEMRKILSDPSHNTPPSAGEPTRIGVMPNLRNILNHAPLAVPASPSFWSGLWRWRRRT